MAENKNKDLFPDCTTYVYPNKTIKKAVENDMNYI